MNITRFLAELALALGDPALATYDADALTAAMYRSVREYSRYRPARRRIGHAVALAAVSASATEVDVVGGPFAAGDVVAFDALGTVETRTLTAVAPTSTTGDGVACGQTLSFSSALTASHAAGCLCARASAGIALVAGTAAYALPYDLIDVERDSFDVATGRRDSYKREAAFGSGSRYASRLSGVGIGQSQGFRAPTGAGAFALPPSGVPATPCVRYDVETGGSPPYLTIAPAPTSASVLDFWYLGQHVPATVPDSEMEAVLAYARYSAIAARINGIVAGGSAAWEEDDVKEDATKAAQHLSGLAASALDDWKRLMVNRPYMVSG